MPAGTALRPDLIAKDVYNAAVQVQAVKRTLLRLELFFASQLKQGQAGIHACAIPLLLQRGLLLLYYPCICTKQIKG